MPSGKDAADVRPVLLESALVFVGPRMNLARLDGGAVALLVEHSLVDLVGQFVDGHPAVVVLVEDLLHCLVQRQPLNRGGRGGRVARR